MDLQETLKTLKKATEERDVAYVHMFMSEKELGDIRVEFENTDSFGQGVVSYALSGVRPSALTLKTCMEHAQELIMRLGRYTPQTESGVKEKTALCLYMTRLLDILKTVQEILPYLKEAPLET